MSMTQEGGARAVERLIQQYGCLPSINDGPRIEVFDPILVAQAIEHEVQRAGDFGWTKITLHLDLPDAAKLAQALRK